MNEEYFIAKKESFEKVIVNFLTIILSFIEENYIFFLTEEIIDVINNFEKIRSKAFFDSDNLREICVFDLEKEEFFDILEIFEISKNGKKINLFGKSFFVPNDIEFWVQDAKYGMEYLSDSLVE
jgi:hypothetical protein